jgi:radical SAM superfamily enzyme YgiQ (UPF0313 family)|tara:strand:+ start:447 stop:2087 length:1641 start_codon:yes stop_codon:yes gene_type:complete
MVNKLIKNVLLINPPGKLYVRADGGIGERKHCAPPIGIAYIAACLEQSGYDVSVIDALAEGYDNEIYSPPFLIYGLPIDQIVDKGKSIIPDVIGISILFSNRIIEAHQIARSLKKALPEVKIVFGGQHPTAMPLDVMQNNAIDFVLTGEADRSMPQLMDALNGLISFEKIGGVFYRNSDGEICDTMQQVSAAKVGKGWKYYGLKQAPVPKKLDDLPYPAWHIFPMETYWNSNVRVGGGDIMRQRFAVMMSSRGCPHSCNFCTSPLLSGFKAYRQRSNESVINEIRHLIDTYGVQEIQFLDDNFFVGAPRVKRLCKMLKDEFGEDDVIFSVPAGADINAIDEETIDLMAEASFHKVVLAIEAGDPDVQKKSVDKIVKLDRVVHLVDYIRNRNMTVHSLFMIGFPDETASQIQKTVDLALSLNVDDFFISIATPLPGTPLYDDCLKRGLLVDGFDPNNLRYSVSNIKLPDMPGEELESIRRTAWVEMKSRQHRQTGSIIKGSLHEFKRHEDYEHAGLKTRLTNTKRSSRNGGDNPIFRKSGQTVNDAQ